MTFSIGIDMGGTKIAGALFDKDNNEIAQKVLRTPENYSDLITTCLAIIEELEQKCGKQATVGVGVPGAIDQATGIIPFTGNTPALDGKPLRRDLETALHRTVRLANDADCAALSEAVDGPGMGYRTVFGLIMGTGVGGGFVIDKKIVEGANGVIGEFAHLPLPFREVSDGPVAECVCRQKGCIEKSINGAGLSRLFESKSGKKLDAIKIVDLIKHGDHDARTTLDQYYTTVAKAMVTIIHTFDPMVIIVCGGMNNLPGFYEEIPKRWGKYALTKTPKTKLLPAKHGSMTGLRGAAWVGRQ